MLHFGNLVMARGRIGHIRACIPVCSLSLSLSLSLLVSVIQKVSTRQSRALSFYHCTQTVWRVLAHFKTLVLSVLLLSTECLLSPDRVDKVRLAFQGEQCCCSLLSQTEIITDSSTSAAAMPTLPTASSTWSTQQDQAEEVYVP